MLAVVIGGALFLTSSRTTQIASHDAVLRPDRSGEVVLRTGAILPDVRLPSHAPIGVAIDLGKTNAESTDELVQRYALIAGAPDGPVTRVREELTSMALESALRGAALAVVPLLVWAAVGRERRRALLRGARSWRGVAVLAAGVLVAVAVVQPWDDDEDTLDADQRWQSLTDFLGPEVPIPSGLEDVEVRGDVTTSQTRRLVESAVSTYDKSKVFYQQAADVAATLALHQPAEDETVVLVVSDRHDNIGMDQVARAVGDAGSADAVFDLGDDTSTGSTWEAFSLDSLDAAFDDAPYADARWAVTGNHDNGTFVGRYLGQHGWDVLTGTVVDGPGGTRLLGVGDPRASGLGNWRDETGLSFDEVEDRVSDAACASEDRISTILVHDAHMASEALDRGCADLVIGGHIHVRSGPDAVTGSNGAVGYSYTTGTTGGAAYAIAVGASIRRPADIGLLTYRAGRPVGIQGVLLQTDGTFEVGDYVTLTPSSPTTPAAGSPAPR